MAHSEVWVVDVYDLTRSMMEDVQSQLTTRLLALMSKYKTEIEDYMKRTAAWTDRTGNLRQGLSASVDLGTPDTIILKFGYSEDYGVYLEYRADLMGRFAIINPTYDLFAPKFLDEVTQLLNSL